MPGIGFSPDQMLRNRLPSHADAHRYRLEVDDRLIPSMSEGRRHLRDRMIAHSHKARSSFGQSVGKGLGIDVGWAAAE